MTKQELSQLCYLNREIGQLQKQLDSLNRAVDEAGCLTVDQVKGSSISFPYVLHNITLEGYTDIDVNKIKRLKRDISDTIKLIEMKKEKCMYEFNRLNRYIIDVPDSQMRQILTYRYIIGLGWKQIAFNIGEYDESYVRRKHNKFISESEKINLAENVGSK